MADQLVLGLTATGFTAFHHFLTDKCGSKNRNLEQL